ncbi:hypothetical protein U472_14405 [Orenia metallireducens]|uniref:Major facilitator superfamily (MFS) profile domain-containing protein n=1 Tax=Orenia metallireducens TaxID=1413210 RepID=A0A1C0A5W3_9FIRM|nr:hypothetical protein [Orenia metallireducens]OCL25527.1 hypothetical protein U472_14405 [Orenia metallireducens]
MFAIIGMILFGFSFLLTDNFLIVILIMTIFSVFWNPITPINFINVNSGDRFKATGQNLYATTSGISAICASLIGRVIYDKLGGSNLYLYLSLIALVTGIIYFILLNNKEGIKAS